MDQATKNEVFRSISELEQLDTSKDDWFDEMTAPRSEGVLRRILEPLLIEEGYSTNHVVSPLDYGPDFFASRPEDDGLEFTIGVLQKHYAPGKAISAEIIVGSLAGMQELGIDRMLVVVNTRFTESALDVARKADPEIIELLDIPALRSWVGGIEISTDIGSMEMDRIVRIVSNVCVKKIAADPRFLEATTYLTGRIYGDFDHFRYFAFRHLTGHSRLVK